MSSTDPNRTKPHARSPKVRLRITYALALLIVAALAIGGQQYTDRFLTTQVADAALVNISGRQRFTSQQLAKQVLKLAYDTTAEARSQTLEAMKVSLTRWERQHRGLIEGDTALGLPGNNSPALQQLFTDLTPHFDQMATAIHRVIDAPDDSSRAALLPAATEIVIAQEGKFLAGMEKIVYQYADEAKAKVASLRRNQLLILGATLLALLLIGLIIFEPVIRAIGRNVRQLNESYAALNEKNVAIEKAHKEVEQYAEETRMVNENLAASRDEIARSLEALKATQRELVEAEKMASLGQLVAGVAHEVNTPLGIALSLSSNLELMADELSGIVQSGVIKKSDIARFSTDIKESTGLMITNLQRAADLVQSFKKVAVNQSSEVLMEFNLRDNLGDILNTVKNELKHAGVEYDIKGPEMVKMTSLPSAMFQVITNLTMNALKHGFEGMSGLKKIEISYQPIEHGFVEISFRDNGRGIPSDVLPRIFDPFFTTKRNQGGSGLGLHIVYNLVTQRLKGQITCFSDHGRGTEFRLRVAAVLDSSQLDATEVTAAALAVAR